MNGDLWSCDKYRRCLDGTCEAVPYRLRPRETPLFFFLLLFSFSSLSVSLCFSILSSRVTPDLLWDSRAHGQHTTTKRRRTTVNCLCCSHAAALSPRRWPTIDSTQRTTHRGAERAYIGVSAARKSSERHTSPSSLLPAPACLPPCRTSISISILIATTL